MNSKRLMKKCQTGVGNHKGALDDANNLLAECYGHIGELSIHFESFISQYGCDCDRPSCSKCEATHYAKSLIGSLT